MKALSEYVTHIPDYPKEGILFHDVTTILQDAEGFQLAIDTLLEMIDPKSIDAICGIESRGFVFGAPLAYQLQKPFILARKQNKLPRETVRHEFALEYGTDVIEIHKDSFNAGSRILIFDDLIATGGSAKATANLIEAIGGQVAGFLFLMELTELKGRQVLGGYDIKSAIRYDR